MDKKWINTLWFNYILCESFKSVLYEFVVLQSEVHDLRQNVSVNMGSPHHKKYGDSYGAEGLQETFNPVQSFHGVPLTGQCYAYVHLT